MGHKLVPGGAWLRVCVTEEGSKGGTASPSDRHGRIRRSEVPIWTAIRVHSGAFRGPRTLPGLLFGVGYDQVCGLVRPQGVVIRMDAALSRVATSAGGWPLQPPLCCGRLSALFGMLGGPPLCCGRPRKCRRSFCCHPRDDTWVISLGPAPPLGPYSGACARVSKQAPRRRGKLAPPRGPRRLHRSRVRHKPPGIGCRFPWVGDSQCPLRSPAMRGLLRTGASRPSGSGPP